MGVPHQPVGVPLSIGNRLLSSLGYILFYIINLALDSYLDEDF